MDGNPGCRGIRLDPSKFSRGGQSVALFFRKNHMDKKTLSVGLASLLLVLLALHTLRVILTGAFQRPKKLNWVVGCLLLFLCVFEAYTGYLLPMDQLAYWATETGMELLRALPLGGSVRSLLVRDGVGGPLSLLRFYALHVVVIPLCVLGLSMLHFFVIRRQRGLLPYL